MIVLLLYFFILWELKVVSIIQPNNTTNNTMSSFNYSLNTLFEFAIPVRGVFSTHIGQAFFGDYKTLVMTQTGEIKTSNAKYSMI